MKLDSSILVAGANGMVGRAIERNLQSKGYVNIIRGTRSSIDFTNQEATDSYFRLKQPEYVFVAAAKCGGIFDNINYPVNYLLDNLNIQNNIISSAYKYNVKRLMFFASSCIYPKNCSMPIKEEYLLTGELEKTNEPYSVAKIAGIKLCDAYRTQYGCEYFSVNPCNVYGPNDKFDPMHGHVMSSLIYKIWKAKKENIKEVQCFGDGSPKREFIYADDLADAAVSLMTISDPPSIVNIGTGVDHSIMDIAKMISSLVEYDGELIWDTSKPNGVMRKVLDVSKLNLLGWKPSITLEQGILKVIESLER